VELSTTISAKGGKSDGGFRTLSWLDVSIGQGGWDSVFKKDFARITTPLPEPEGDWRVLDVLSSSLRAPDTGTAGALGRRSRHIEEKEKQGAG
jgi:hypothetical protein